MKTAARPPLRPSSLLLPLAAIAGILCAVLFPAPTQAQATLSASWPCYLKLYEKWYDCPTRVVGGKYVLGEPLPPPILNAYTEFTVSRADRLFVDGVARCENCQQLMNDWQLALQRWDGARWTNLFLGQANRVISCAGWSERCNDTGGRAWLGVAPGRYRLWAHTGFSTGGGGDFYPRTQLELAVHLESGGSSFGTQPPPGAAGGFAGEIEWVECAIAGGFSTAGIGDPVDCRGQGLWRVDGRGDRGALSVGGRFDYGDRLETGGNGFARARLADGTELLLQPGTRVAVERTQATRSEVVLFFGRVLSFFSKRASGDGLRVKTSNAIVGVEGTTWETAYDQSSGVTAVMVADGAVNLACSARPEMAREVRAGERARIEGNCAVCFDFPGPEELDRMGELGAYRPTGFGSTGDLGPTGDFGSTGGDTAAAGSYIGCYKDGGQVQGTEGHDLDGELLWPDQLTPRLCARACAERGYAYAGVQWGRACYCGSDYGRFGASDECTTPCWGDGGQICGGYQANSVYATGGGAGFGGQVARGAGEIRRRLSGRRLPWPRRGLLGRRGAIRRYAGRQRRRHLGAGGPGMPGDPLRALGLPGAIGAGDG